MASGEMAEWFKAQTWKVCLGKLNEGSNPSLSVFKANIQCIPTREQAYFEREYF
jgi:hypothetical protein